MGFSQPVFFFLVFMTFLLLLAKVDRENDDKIFFISIASFLYCSIVVLSLLGCFLSVYVEVLAVTAGSLVNDCPTCFSAVSGQSHLWVPVL